MHTYAFKNIRNLRDILNRQVCLVFGKNVEEHRLPVAAVPEQTKIRQRSLWCPCHEYPTRQNTHKQTHTLTQTHMAPRTCEKQKATSQKKKQQGKKEK